MKIYKLSALSTFAFFSIYAIWLVHIIGSVSATTYYYEKSTRPFPLSYRNNNRVEDMNDSNLDVFMNFTLKPIKQWKSRRIKIVKQPNYDNTNMIDNRPMKWTDKDDETIYIGFTKNPFGPSKTLVRGESSKKIKDVRDKRGVVQLYNMVSCATGCDPISYKGYGCYCGFLGSGEITDGIDRCCKIHDLCYSSVNCPMFLVYFMPYLWKCWKGKPLCAVDHLGYGNANSCAARLCECDRQLAVCLSRSPCPKRRAMCMSSPWRLLQNVLMFF